MGESRTNVAHDPEPVVGALDEDTSRAAGPSPGRSRGLPCTAALDTVTLEYPVHRPTRDVEVEHDAGYQLTFSVELARSELVDLEQQGLSAERATQGHGRVRSD